MSAFIADTLQSIAILGLALWLTSLTLTVEHMKDHK